MASLELEDLARTVVQLQQRVDKLEQQQNQHADIIAALTAKPPEKPLTLNHLRSLYDRHKNRPPLMVRCPEELKLLKGGKSFGLHHNLHKIPLVLPVVFKKDNPRINVTKYLGVVFEEDKSNGEQHGKKSENKEDDGKQHEESENEEDEQHEESEDKEDDGKQHEESENEEDGEKQHVESENKEDDKEDNKKPPTPYNKKLRTRPKRKLEDTEQQSSTNKRQKGRAEAPDISFKNGEKIIFLLDDGISGEGNVCHGTTCHNIKLKPNEVRILVTDVDPEGSTHPIYKHPIEKGSFTAVPAEKLHR